ncbi:uncharacterized protein LOC114758054 [Neltuma alba]|uniref:uncharacterized protein LOC114758054 n=1 Tax=Neltuma alba TaxID=207710 RepID=UPI0010A37CDA|nr:uncharacterized protein LOC114758054 [Prosopis alba]
MEDQANRKVPPDRPSDALVCGSKKKTKQTAQLQPILDTHMDETQATKEEEMMKEPEVQEQIQKDKMETPGRQPPSYRDSLLGFNGVANGSCGMEEDELLLDVLNTEWEMPEETEEINALMKQFPTVPIEPEEYAEWCKPWNSALIITVLGRKYNVHFLKRYLGRLWNVVEFDLIDIPNNYFVVKLPEKEGWADVYKKILYEGPWVVQQQSVLVQRWSLNFDPFNNPLRKIATWVRIPNIPLHCCNKKFITRLGNIIGKTLRVDLRTCTEATDRISNVERGRFARVCVEIDLQKKLVPKVIAANRLYQVEYEGLNLICFECGRHGHKRENCSWTYAEGTTGDERSKHHGVGHAPPAGATETRDKQRSNQEEKKARKSPATDEMFGSWMLVTRPTKARTSRYVTVSETRETQGGAPRNVRTSKFGGLNTRFAALQDMAEEEEGSTEANSAQTKAEPSALKLRAMGQRYIAENRSNEGQKMKMAAHDRTKKGKEAVRNKANQSGLGKENAQPSGPTAREKAQMGVDERNKTGGEQKPRTAKVNEKPRDMGRRSHIVVAGDIHTRTCAGGGIEGEKTHMTNSSRCGSDMQVDQTEGDNLIIQLGEVDPGEKCTCDSASKQYAAEGDGVGD